MGWEEIMDILACYFRVEDHHREHPVFEVVIDERLSLKIIQGERNFIIFCGYFTEKNTENDLQKLKHLLQWNFARIAETDDSLSIESESNQLCLFRKRHSSELFMDNIFAEVESFVENLEFWADAFEYMRVVPRGSGLTVFGF
ncbi:MAG: hypothetical protein LBB11_01390 [Puniceicoccales bacterium]|jgi:hypothetical protein|nr:hypothetical protein [Puniceicoccales bacterium]